MGDNEEKRPKIISLFDRKRSTRSSVAGLQSLQRTAKCAGALGLQCLLTHLSFCQEIYVAKWSIYERRAETHERFYMIEVHRHRFARHARKVPFEKCEHWRKVCGRSAKDQIASTL